MNVEKQRIAIAQACGWVWYRVPASAYDANKRYRTLFLPEIHEYEGQSPHWLVRADGSERICNIEYMAREGFVPDYPNNLNAMHDAEEWILHNRPADWMKYCRQVCNDFEPDAIAIHATAAQRAEAFLKAIGKWEAD